MRTLSSLTAVVFLLIVVPAGAAVSTNQSGWLWGTPEPQGNSLPALELQGMTGYAAGDFGTLLRTNDGGGSWGTVRTGLSLDFSEIDVIDADSIVVASPCAIRRTDNGGESFRRLPYTSSERNCPRRLLGMSFPTSDVGYLLLDEGGLLRTEDGGRSFSTRSVPGGGGFLTALMFRSANEGIAASSGGDIFKTTNGGNSWTREFDGDRGLQGVLFTDTQAVAVGAGGNFLVSANDGDTWTRPSDAPGAPTPPDAEFAEVRCASAAVCLIRAFFPSHLYRTADGGRSFTRVDVSNVQAVDFASATRAVTVGGLGETHLSNDGGATFSQLGSRIERLFGSTLNRVRATSTRVAHAIGEAGAVIRTTDGGETWNDVGVPGNVVMRDVWFPTASVGYALDFTGGLFRTENGGGSWSILDTGTNRAPSGVYAADGSHVFLLGPRGVLRSNNGGDTFERHTHRVIRNRTIEEADQAGSAVVFFGPRVIALSTNEGNKWRHVERPSRSEVRHVDFVSSRVGYVLEQSGRLYFTRNRGKRWTELATGYTNGQRLAFGTRRNGWLDIGSSHPSVLHTTDGGKSWTPQILGSQQAIGIAAAGTHTGFATLRSAAEILFTDDGGEAGADSRLTLSDRVVRRGSKFKLKGRLTPAEGGEDVEVRVRPLNGRRWREIDVTPNKRGRFSFRRRIGRATVFVAQWEGDADSNGDGSRPLIVNPRG